MFTARKGIKCALLVRWFLRLETTSTGRCSAGRLTCHSNMSEHSSFPSQCWCGMYGCPSPSQWWLNLVCRRDAASTLLAATAVARNTVADAAAACTPSCDAAIMSATSVIRISWGTPTYVMTDSRHRQRPIAMTYSTAAA